MVVQARFQAQKRRRVYARRRWLMTSSWSKPRVARSRSRTRARSISRTGRDQARPGPLLPGGRRAAAARHGRPTGAAAALSQRGERIVVLSEAGPRPRPDWLETTIVSTPNGTTSRARWSPPISPTSCGRSTSAASASTCGPQASDPDHADELRIDLDPTPGVGSRWCRRRRARSARSSTSLASSASPRRPATAASTCTSRLQPRWTPTRCVPRPWRSRASSNAAVPTSSRLHGGRRSAAARLRRLQPERSAQDHVRRLVGAGPPRCAGLDPVRVG